MSPSAASSDFPAPHPALLAGWDEFDAYLFDIDGTLMRDPGQVHFRAFSQCLREAMGRDIPLDNVPIHGSTDPAILRDAFRASSVPEAEWAHLEPSILARLAELALAQRGSMTMQVLPAVRRVLEHLRGRGASLGVATGNIESIGWLKLEVAGLRDCFAFGGFSDSFPLRADMIANAVAVARAQAGSATRICVVGDTPFDIAAARANGLPTLAVATGIFSLQQLAEHSPEFCVSTFEALLPAQANV